MLLKGKLKRMGFLKVPSVICPEPLRIRPGLPVQLCGDTCTVHPRVFASGTNARKTHKVWTEAGESWKRHTVMLILALSDCSSVPNQDSSRRIKGALKLEMIQRLLAAVF